VSEPAFLTPFKTSWPMLVMRRMIELFASRRLLYGEGIIDYVSSVQLPGPGGGAQHDEGFGR
jgi:hypothetical protein